MTKNLKEDKRAIDIKALVLKNSNSRNQISVNF